MWDFAPSFCQFTLNLRSMQKPPPFGMILVSKEPDARATKGGYFYGNGGERMTRNLYRDSLIPPYMAYPRFLLDMDISETAKLVYVLLLDRARLSMQNDGWTDDQSHVFIYYTIQSLAEITHKGETSIKAALADLEQQDLIYRQRQGAGRPSKIFVRVPTTVQSENRPSGGMDIGPQTVGKPTRSNKQSNNNRKTIRNYDFEEGESL